MKVSDIQWNSTVIEFSYTDEEVKELPVESEVVVDYDSNFDKFFIAVDNKIFYLIPSVSGKGALEKLVKDVDKRERISWILDITEKTISVKFIPFNSAIFLNAFQSLQIEVSNSVVQQLKKSTSLEALSVLENQFLYKNVNDEKVIFVIGINEFDSHKNEKAFTIISNNKRLTVSKVNDKLVAVNIARQRGDVYSPISAFYGNISFVASGEAAEISEACSKQLENTLSADGYLSMWNEYNQLERLLVMQESLDYGHAQYDDYTVEIHDNIIYKFKVSNCKFQNIDEGVELDVTTDDRITEINPKEILDGTAQEDIAGNYVGEFIKHENGIVYVVDKKNDSPNNKIPKKGYLFKSVQGDRKRLRRRDDAKKAIASGTAPISNLGMLINTGVSANKSSHNYPAITPELKRKLKTRNGEEIKFNEQQEHAIKIALNTPDIALIQGPPGTGKTTVIKAIVSRFEEIYKKENNGDFPKILVTSFQHVAVDNAIKGINFSGLPANRFGGKRGEENPQKMVISRWLKDNCAAIDEYASQHTVPEVHAAIEDIKNRVFVWKCTGQDVGAGIDILKEKLSESQFYLSDALRNRIQHLIASRPTETTNVAGTFEDDTRDEFLTALNRLRLTDIAFSDDGLSNLRDFVDDFELGFFDDICKDVKLPECINQVIISKGTDQKAFEEYATFVRELLEKYSPKEVAPVEFNLLEEVENCLNDLIVETRKYLLNKIENIEEAKCEILLQYKDELLFGNAEQIIRDYADIFASTCQQSAPYKDQTPSEYDLVIVDEAARANPLDLFIPMSMAKKIILVGDQKQLPHMIEPSVKKQIQAASEDKLKLYEESFFEYLFNKLKEDGDDLSPFAKACTLTQQYRMLPEISDFVSSAIYEDKLKCGLSNEKVAENQILVPDYNNKSVVWVNVGLDKGTEQDGISKSRESEVTAIFDEIRKIVKVSDKIKSIGIITFYKKQMEDIKSELESNISKTVRDEIEFEIGTVDAFQGKEYDVVFLSCVRSNELPMEDLKKKVGFLRDDNRLCVALSRGRNLLVGIGDEETVSHVDILNNFISYCKTEKGCYCGNSR